MPAPLLSLRPSFRICESGRRRYGYDPAGRVRARLVRRDRDERREVRVSCDDQRPSRIKHDIIGRERRRHARAQREKRRSVIIVIVVVVRGPRVKEDLAERCRRYGHLGAVGGYRDAVCEGDARGGDGCRVRCRLVGPG